MGNSFISRFFLITFSLIFLYSCSQKNNNLDFDLSNLPKPKRSKTIDQIEKNNANENNQFFIKDLVPFEARDKLLSKFEFGKEDPFSNNEIQVNRIGSNLKITGFIDTEIKKYVIVSYLEKEGPISEDSIGGLNTNLLPIGAKVVDIDTKEKKLKIKYDNEDFTFEL